MGIYDRDYMKNDAPAPAQAARKKKDDSYRSIPLWNRILFRLWLIFHPRHTRDKE